MRRQLSFTVRSLAPLGVSLAVALGASLGMVGMVGCGGEPTPTDDPDTPYDETVPVDDNDGIPPAQDFCPDTPPGEAVDDFGCAPGQSLDDTLVPEALERVDIDGDGKRNPAEAVLDAPPPAGQRQRGFVARVGGRDTTGPLVLFAHEDAVEEREGQMRVVGDAALATSDGFVLMTSADLTLDLDEEGDIRGIAGVANVPLPTFGLLDGAEVSGFGQAQVGYDTGAALAHLRAPLAPERSYLYFVLAASAGVRVGSLDFDKDAPGAQVVWDPTDPFVFLRGDLVGLGSLGPLEDIGLGLSFGGHIPFEAEIEPERFEDFRGHCYVEGSLSVPKIPFAMVGHAVVELPEGEVFNDDSRLGANGTLLVEHELFGVFKLDLELAEASAVVQGGQATRAEFVGVPARSVFKTGPIRDEASFVAGVVSDKAGDSYVEGRGRFVLDGVWLSSHTPFQVADIPLLTADLYADHTGASLTGRLELIPELPGVILSAGVEVEVSIPADGLGYEIIFRGDAEIEGVFQANAVVILGPGGITVGAGP